MMLKWSDEALGGRGYVDWHPFDHPQLGPVELGGWDALFTLKNPPPWLLEKEIAPFPDWLVWHLLISPRLEVFRATATPLSADLWRVELVVRNSGWLPSYVTKKALEKKLVRGVICEIALPAGAELVTGKIREELGQLEGRAYKPSAPGGFFGNGADVTRERARAQWVVRAPAGAIVELLARHERAGVARAEVRLATAPNG